MDIQFNQKEETNNKDLFRIEIDLLNKFKEVCIKNGLTYFASSGTLLGAVRHNGFIPWDDDIDLFLYWNDYKKLLSIADKEFSYPYFFQSHLSEKEGEASACRLRRSDTTGCTKWEIENITDPNYNRGIFIDIFPLFSIPNSHFGKWLQKKRVMFWWSCIRGHDSIREKQITGKSNPAYEKFAKKYKFINKVFSMSVVEMKNRYLNACAYRRKNTKEVGATSSRCHKENLMWNTEWYRGTVELPFENTTISCPIDYEKILEKQYGDWKTPIRSGARHEMVVVNPHISYTEYFQK